MSRRSKHSTAPLRVRELAVNPADVNRGHYPVRIRLSRAMTSYEEQSLASVDPAARADGDVIVLDHARIDDIAHDHVEWDRRLEMVERMGEELEGAHLIATQQRDDQLRDSASRRLGKRHDPYTMG